jgi:predicted alpha-1,2-mannosidase
MLRSLTQMARDGGEVPRWPLGHGYTGGMIGTPADQVFAESWLKGLVDWPVEEAFEASFAHARSGQAKAGRSGLQSYLSKGYVSVEETGQGASKTLEYSWSDYALSEWAHGLGRSDEAEILSLQATNWKNSWDPDQGFFVARRDDGTFQELSNQFFWDEAFVEGNAWHYRWGVPFDVPGLIELQYAGDTDQFITDLDNYWAEVYHEENDYLPDDWYWHGNEPDIHYAYLASMAGRWEESSDPIRWLMANRYFDGPVGLDGNDDSGTLSAWYLFSAVGFYPIAGTDRYAVGSPNFERIEIDLADRTLVVRAPGLSEGARRTVGLSLDGSAWTQPQVSHEALVSGEWLFDLE